MMLFNVCVNDTVELLWHSMNFLVEELLMIWLNTWLSTTVIVGCQCITIETKQILILQNVSKLTLYQIMKYGSLL